MIVVDTSALIAIILREPSADQCIEAMVGSRRIAISAATLAEALVVADRKRLGKQMRRLVGEFAFEVVPLTAERSERVAAAYSRWGKGVHPAKLNLGDCFAYALAIEHRCPLLYIGQDFARTDIESAL